MTLGYVEPRATAGPAIMEEPPAATLACRAMGFNRLVASG
jgi:hypothetical protein